MQASSETDCCTTSIFSSLVADLEYYLGIPYSQLNDNTSHSPFYRDVILRHSVSQYDTKKL